MRLSEGGTPRKVAGVGWEEDVQISMFMRPLTGDGELPAAWRDAFEHAVQRFDGQPFRLSGVERTKDKQGTEYLVAFFETDWKAVAAAHRLAEPIDEGVPRAGSGGQAD